MLAHAVRPARGEAADYYFKYIDMVADGDICDLLEAQRAETLAFLRTVPESQAHYRYESDKWSVSGVVAHVNDCERLFAFRAFWFARGFDSPLPSFDQHVAARHDDAERRSWSGLIDEFDSVRTASLHLFRHMSDEAWLARGIASDNPFTVRALAFIAAGHVTHHMGILRERYLQRGAAAGS